MQKFYFLLIAITAASLSSACKKHYSCQCTTRYEKPGYFPLSATSIEPLTEETTKKGAEKFCDQAEKQLIKNNEDYKNADETMDVSCAVK